MRGRIVDVNYQRDLAIFEDATGDYGCLEMLESDNLEKDDIILGDLNCTGRQIITKLRTGKSYKVFIEDFGMSLEIARRYVFPD